MLAGHDFAARTAAAAAAGFGGLGLRNGGYAAARAAGRSDADLRALLTHHGVRLVDLQPLMAWALGEEAGRASRAEEETAYRIAGALGGADHVTATGHGCDGPFEVVVERFAALCDRAAAHGLRVGLEFLPWTPPLDDAPAAWRVVAAAGRANGGVVVDAWHVERGSGDLAQVRAVPPQRIVAVHLDDGGPQLGDAVEDTRRRRRLPGEGGFRLTAFVRELEAAGWRGPWGIEVLSEQLDALPVEEAARRAAEATHAVLAAARGGA
jgi:sugar phosphate isomerase/epimerase